MSNNLAACRHAFAVYTFAVYGSAFFRRLKFLQQLNPFGQLHSVATITLRAIKLMAAALIAVTLAGCSGASNLASNIGLSTPAEGQKLASTARPVKSVAFAPLVGVPATVSSRMLVAVKNAARAKKLPVTEEIASAGYLVRGYLVAAPETTGAKLSYIWDINDSKGVRIHRLMGSELLKGPKTQNGWSLVNDSVIQKVADASTTKLSGWFSTAKPKSPASDPRNIAPGRRNDLVASNNRDPEVTGAVTKRQVSLATRVVPVRGAPGDGRISLTNALRRELSKNGIALTTKKVAGGYSVKGDVKLRGAGGGRQEVRIVWNVYDGKGDRVGTVSQKNRIPAGSLNGPWGRTAEAAASAAAKGIIKLLPGKGS